MLQAYQLICESQWSNKLLEVELLAKTARLALLQNNYTLVNFTSSMLYILVFFIFLLSSLSLSLSLLYLQVSQCTTRALERATPPEDVRVKKKGTERKRPDPARLRQEKELLSSICSLQGQSLVAEGEGNASANREALKAFLQSAKLVGSYVVSRLLK